MPKSTPFDTGNDDLNEALDELARVFTARRRDRVQATLDAVEVVLREAERDE